MCVMCNMTGTFDPSRHLDGSGFDGTLDGPIAATVSETTDAASSTSTAYSMSVGDSFNGTVSSNGDRDWVAITLTAGESYDIALNGGSLSDPYLRLYDSSGNLIGYNDDGGPGLNSAMSYNATSTGTYYVSAGGYADIRSGTYSLSVTSAGTTPPTGSTEGTLDELANFLTHGYWGGSSRSFGNSTITVNLTGLTAAGQQLARWALEAWEAVAGLTFHESAGSALITFDDNDSGAYAYSTTSGTTILSSNINVSTNWLNSYGTTIDSYSFSTYVHEIGHALGLGHQGDYNGNATYGVDDTYSNDSWQVSIMSYFNQTENTTTNASYAALISAMMSDIVAIQNLYGAPTTDSDTSGDTTWGAGTNLSGYMADAMAALASSTNSQINGNAVAFTIYDRDGTDTLDLSYNSSNDRVDLNGETFSDVSGLIGNLGIARGTVIENFVAGSGNDTVVGNEVANVIYGNGGNDTIEGGVGYDTLYGGAGSDSLFGGSGRDSLLGEGGNDSLTGGTGDDTLYGGDGNDTMYGNTSLDTLYGGAGDDYISAGDGVDSVNGDAGNDTIYGRSGWDVLNGNVGNDSIYGSEGDDTLNGGDDQDWLSGGSAWDVLFGNDGDDTLYGNFGSDVLSGGGGADQLFGGTGDDSLRGGDGNDTLQGNQGVDRLDGGAGDDLLRGGTLRDTFVFNTGYDNDEINDFEEHRDILLLSTSLTGGSTNAADIISDYGAVVNGQVVFDFGNGDVLTLSNLSTLSGLEDNISTF